MNIVLNSLALLLTFFGAYIVVMNYGGVIMTYRNKRRGIDKHYSTVPFVAQIFLLLAALAFSAVPNRWLPQMWLVAIGLADISLWNLFALPFRFLFRRR